MPNCECGGTLGEERVRPTRDGRAQVYCQCPKCGFRFGTARKVTRPWSDYPRFDERAANFCATRMSGFTPESWPTALAYHLEPSVLRGMAEKSGKPLMGMATAAAAERLLKDAPAARLHALIATSRAMPGVALVVFDARPLRDDPVELCERLEEIEPDVAHYGFETDETPAVRMVQAESASAAIH